MATYTVGGRGGRSGSMQSYVPHSRPTNSNSGSNSGSGSGSGSGSNENIDANKLLELYQKGLGASSGPSTEDQLTLLREGNKLDLARKSAEQDMQMKGQEQALDQAQKARAKERETEATLQRRQQSTERGNAMAAYRGL